jgi:hypothetical protein
MFAMKRGIAGLATTLLVSGGLGLAGLGLAAGVAQADLRGPYQWCPGQSMQWPTGPWGLPVVWDMNVCHTWWVVVYGQGNVPMADGRPSVIWEGDNPPPPTHHDPLCPPGRACFPWP